MLLVGLQNVILAVSGRHGGTVIGSRRSLIRGIGVRWKLSALTEGVVVRFSVFWQS
jgi:hypothetical protein